jgi:hypothetical protein
MGTALSRSCGRARPVIRATERAGQRILTLRNHQHWAVGDPFTAVNGSVRRACREPLLPMRRGKRAREFAAYRMPALPVDIRHRAASERTCDRRWTPARASTLAMPPSMPSQTAPCLSGTHSRANRRPGLGVRCWSRRLPSCDRHAATGRGQCDRVVPTPRRGPSSEPPVHLRRKAAHGRAVGETGRRRECR